MLTHSELTAIVKDSLSNACENGHGTEFASWTSHDIAGDIIAYNDDATDDLNFAAGMTYTSLLKQRQATLAKIIDDLRVAKDLPKEMLDVE